MNNSYYEWMVFVHEANQLAYSFAGMYGSAFRYFPARRHFADQKYDRNLRPHI